MVTKDIIKNSLEAKWRKHQTLFWIAFFSFIFFVAIIIDLMICIGDNDFSIFIFALGIACGIWVLPIISFSGFYFYKYKRLFRNLEDYQIYEVMLDKPSTSWNYKGAVYYTISFKIDNGNIITKDTLPIWSSSLMSVASLEDYNNKKIKIAYSDKEDEIIVLGL